MPQRPARIQLGLAGFELLVVLARALIDFVCDAE
jgi:hypothetical protein